MFLSSYPHMSAPSKAVFNISLRLKWCRDHHELTVDFHGDEKEESSIKKNGPGKFVRQLF
jgi:hypothetical protein